MVSKMPAPPKGLFGPGDFEVSEDREQAKCPAGHASTKVWHRKAEVLHHWVEDQCTPCPLKDRCLRGKSARRILTVAPDFHDRRAREDYARSPDGREKLRTRVFVEHAIGYLKNLGAGQARYIGKAKTLFQWFVCGAVQNLRRIFSLAGSVAPLLLWVLLPLLFLAASTSPTHAATTLPCSQQEAQDGEERTNGLVPHCAEAPRSRGASLSPASAAWTRRPPVTAGDLPHSSSAGCPQPRRWLPRGRAGISSAFRRGIVVSGQARGGRGSGIRNQRATKPGATRTGEMRELFLRGP